MEAVRLPTKKLVVVGCGNLNRTDDGAGVVIAHQLKEWLSHTAVEHVGVFDAGTGGMDVMFQARGATCLIIADACRTGSQPGSIFKIPADEIVSQPVRGYSLHDFRWDHALYIGRKFFKTTFPADVTVYLVEAADLSYGVELTPVVSAAVDHVVGQIKEHITGWSADKGN
jgi:hydrogenase maturation protease